MVLSLCLFLDGERPGPLVLNLPQPEDDKAETPGELPDLAVSGLTGARPLGLAESMASISIMPTLPQPESPPPPLVPKSKWVPAPTVPPPQPPRLDVEVSPPCSYFLGLNGVNCVHIIITTYDFVPLFAMCQSSFCCARLNFWFCTQSARFLLSNTYYTCDYCKTYFGFPLCLLFVINLTVLSR